MIYATSTLPSQTDGLTLTTYAWNEVREPKAVVQLSHGLAEHAGRYDRLATALNGAGYLVFAHDHPGHGATGEAAGSIGSFGAAECLQRRFEHRTGYEWLSRDEAEVDLYVADPWCGLEASPDVMPQMFGSASRLADGAVLAGIRKDLPILVVSGDADPLAGGGALVDAVGQRYRDAGITDVTVRLFPEARHEIFNETNRDEITALVINWLDAHPS